MNRFFGKPQDLEWAISGGRLYLLQARPVTGFEKIPDRSGACTIWDNSNIIESYAGVTTPLTFSFIQEVYTEVYQEFCRMMGVEEELIGQNKDLFRMLGLIKGRVYYNLLHWYQVLSLLPGYEINARFMEQMMGVKERLTVAPTVIHSQRNPYWRVGVMFFNLIRQLVTLPKESACFYRLLDDTLLPYENTDLSEVSSEELIQIYRRLERKLLRKWHAPLVNDFYAMIFYGLLKQFIAKWGLDPQGTLQNDLLAGEGGLVSTEPVHQLRRIANEIAGNDQLKEFFLENDSGFIIRKLGDYPELQGKFQEHLGKYGIRCPGELKLETFTYRDKPELLIELLKSYVKQGYSDPAAARERERLIRKKAEDKVKMALGKRIARRLVLKIILSQARQKVKNRENLRFERTRVFAMVRRIFLALGYNLAQENFLEQPRDIFYLTKEEIFDFGNGTAAATDLKSLVALRKIEFLNFPSITVPDRFETYGPVFAGDNLVTKTASAKGEQTDLAGTGCSPGLVVAPIKKIFDLNQEITGLEGCILVAERTDPGWAPLFPLARGILVERGSILSHSAIVAREMGILAIVGINNLMRTLVDGELVEMDGGTGEIRRKFKV